MKKLPLRLLLACVPLWLYLMLWPVPVEPVAGQRYPDRGLTGPFAANHRLATASLHALGGYRGPEMVRVRRWQGVLEVWMAVTTDDENRGRLLRWRPESNRVDEMADTGGRPLGFDFAGDGSVVVVDPIQGGVFRVLDAGDGDRIEALLSVPGFLNALTIAADGRIYITESTQRFPPHAHGFARALAFDVLEGRCSGRVLMHDPASGASRVLIEGLCFPNGIALSADGTSLFVSEMLAYRVLRLPLTGGAAQVVLSDLPGFPDNLTRGEQGRLWLALAAQRKPELDFSADKPWLRTMFARWPLWLTPPPPRFAHVLAFSEDGDVLHVLQDGDGRLPSATGVTEFEGALYLHNLDQHELAVIGELPL